jgi:drug/metabolite transporter (DMT)-like permease
MPTKKQFLLILACLCCTYLVWGSTYLAIKFAIESFPPFLMVAVRFTLAGLILYGVMRVLGRPHPSWAEWRSAAVIGLLLPVLGNGTVTHVQQTVSSSLAALMIATAPIWMAIFSSLWGHHINKREWLGIAIGIAGIVLLNLSDTLHGDVLSSLLLVLAAACWSFGSVWSKHLPMASGLMGAASQMLCGGLIAWVLSACWGEVWPASISAKSWVAMWFMIVPGSIITYSAFQWLLKNVRPLVASSNTFVNPIVAFVLGIYFANEAVTAVEYIALAVILVGVFLVLTAQTSEE